MAETSSGSSLSGGCQCGAIRYEAHGAPKWVANCHCSLCRKQTSAAYATWASYPSDAVRFTQGSPSIYEDSPLRQRGFCGECGTQLLGISPKWPDEIHLLTGALDDPNAAPPVLHAYFADALDWVHPQADGLPRFARTRRDGPALD